MNLINKMIKESDKITYEMILGLIKDKELSNKCWNSLQKFKQLSDEDKINQLKKMDINQNLIEFTTNLVGDSNKAKKDIMVLINKLKEEIK
jgi:plasmid maintenance system antidote protein VapI